MFRRRFSSIFLIALLLGFGCFELSAQEFRGSITGRVTDPNGALIPGATVTLKNTETNVELSTTTNADGVYTFPLVQPGRYTLTVTAQGFNTAVREGIEVRVADRLTIDVEMQVGVAATVTTVATEEALETGSVSTGLVIQNRQVSELPLVEGTAYQLATLTPGVVYTGNPMFMGPTSNGNLAAFRANGGIGPNQVTLDGSPNYAFDGGVGFSPPSDAVQEFKVQTNSFDAQQGYTASATVNVALKSGTNDLHGSLWYFDRNRSRTANNFFSNRSGQPRPERTYHRFGGVLNGPVFFPRFGEGGPFWYDGRNRTFFLFSYERLKDNVAEPQLFTVPTLKMRQGDFSELIVNRNNIADSRNTVIYNPFSARQSGNIVVRSSFGCDVPANTPVPSNCNIIPANLINPIAAALIRYYPLPNVPGTANGTQNNYFSNVMRHQNYRAWLIRLDHKISQNQSLFGKYYHSFNPEDRYDWAGVVNGFPITRGFEYRTNDGGNLGYTATLSPTTVFDLRLSLNRFVQERRPAATFDPSTLGFSSQALAAFRGYQYIPFIMIRNLDATRPIRSDLGSQRSDWNAGRLRPFYMGSVQPTVTKLFGNHATKFGYDLRILRENFAYNGYQAGRYFFDGTYTSPASNSSSTLRNAFGRDIAAFLLGVPSAGSGSTASQIDNPIAYSVQSVYHGFFFQDDWRVTPRLTLNLGLRYDLEGGLTERYNRIVRGFDLTTPSPIEAQVVAAYTALYNANPSNFQVPPDQFHVRGGYTYADDQHRAAWNTDTSTWQPRIGVSYLINDKTVVRGGFGIFVAPHQIETPNQVGYAWSTPFVPTNNNGLSFIANLTNPFPSGLQQTPGSSLGLLTNVGLAAGTSDSPIFPVDRKNAKFARVVAGVQRELPGQLIVEATFVAAWGYDLPVSKELNFVPRQYLGSDPTSDAAANAFLSQSVPNPFRGLVPGSPLNTATTIPRWQLLLPYPQFTDLWIQQYNGSNRYKALQLQAAKRFSRDLSFNVTYTRSRLREKVSYLNPSDTQLEDRISPDDRPNRFTLAVVYLLPIGRGRRFGSEMNRALDLVIGGWQLNGTYEWQSGEPFLLTQPLYYADLNRLRQIKSRVGEDDGQGHKYGVDIPAFDTSGFVRLSSFGLRNVPSTLDNLRNQPFLNVNLSLSKNFNFSENKRLQIRVEALNAFNYVYFSAINLDPNNASFGLTTGQRNLPRDVQLGAKFIF
jgi:hypothetical protein